MKSFLNLSFVKLFLALLSLCFITESSAQSATILVNGYPIVAGDTLSICSSSNQLFDVNYTGVGTSVSYAWTFQNGSPSASILKFPYVAFSTIGYNSVEVFVFGSDTASAQIVIHILPSVNPGLVTGVQTICMGTLPTDLPGQMHQEETAFLAMTGNILLAALTIGSIRVMMD